MTKLLSRFDPLAYAAMRIVFAFLYWSHGVRWLFGTFGGRPAPMLSLVWFAGVIETIAGTLMGIGLWTSCAAFVACGEMAVAYFTVHIKRGYIPIRNGGEITVALCFGFLYLATRGSGTLSIDRFRGKR
jgi:putative oxidoreductase